MRAIYSLAAVLPLTVLVAPVQAQAPGRVWVSSAKGVDTPGCAAATSPCRTFQYAVDLIASGGEIDVMDPGGYGQVTINKSVAIVNDGVGPATIGAASGNAITINAGATDNIYLKGLSLNGIGTGSNGIVVNSGGTVTVTDSTIRRFDYKGNYLTGNGILLNVSASTSLTVRNTVTSDNGFVGVYIVPAPSSAPTITAHIEGLTTSNNSYGIAVNMAQATGGGNFLSIVNSTVNKNNYGLYLVKGGAMALNVALKDNRILANTYAYLVSANVLSYGGNTAAGNTAQSGTITPASDF